MGLLSFDGRGNAAVLRVQPWLFLGADVENIDAVVVAVVARLREIERCGQAIERWIRRLGATSTQSGARAAC